MFCYVHIVLFVFFYDDFHINYVVTVSRSKLHIKEYTKIAKFNTLQLYLPLEIAKLSTREIWLLNFREIKYSRNLVRIR